jgi:hypothetical protein
MKKWSEMTEAEKKKEKDLKRDYQNYYARRFRIIRKLPNGQLYCQDRQDGSFIILNDWRT